MNPSDPRLSAAISAALPRISATTAAAIDRVDLTLGVNATSAVSNRDRQAYAAAQLDLRQKLHEFHRTFANTLQDQVAAEVSPRHDAGRRLANTDWMSLSLVEDREVESSVSAGRLGQAIAHECEWELRDLASYMSSLMRELRTEADRNPLRPEVIGRALHKAIEAVSMERDTQRILSREIGAAMATGMRACYADILADLRGRGIQPVGLSVKQVEGPGNEMPRNTTGYTGHSEFNLNSGPGETLGLPSSSPASGLTIPSPLVGHASTLGRRTGTGWTTSSAGLGNRSGVPASADAQLMNLIRRLAVLAGGQADPTQPGQMPAAGARMGGIAAAEGYERFMAGAGVGADSMPRGESTGSGGETLTQQGLGGLMAVNLIRAHRDELIQASSGTLDHMVIDVVGSLFDQILSDPKVPPQMARQIARLQLPVLRVALGDVGFFSSRRHPVRRFVNRIASLACAFDEFDSGPGKRFLGLVRELVQEIVQGDFDQMDLYESKLATLEAFITQQTEEEVEQRGPTTALLDHKETELRVQQRYMQQLKGALAPLSELPEFVRDFLAQVWSQAILLAVNREGADSPRVQRLRLAGRNLAMSVQGKGTPQQRKNFLMQLPQLMKDLNEGMDFIGWPEAAKRKFFGELLPAHAESLKARPQTELEHNLLVKQLDSILGVHVPRAEEMTRADALPVLTEEVPPVARFTPDEAQRIGLVEETAVDWDGTVDIDLSEQEQEPEAEAAPPDGSLDIDQDLAMTPKEPPEPTHGPDLLDHIKLGHAYRMHLKDKWQKVRLSYMSPGRAFFVFTHGAKHQEAVSMTARMLKRMCETERLRTYENAYLIDRATSRARKQLAALGASAAVQKAASTLRH